MPGTLLVVSAPVTSSAAGWITVGIPSTALSAGSYWLAAKFDATSSSTLIGAVSAEGAIQGCICDFAETFNSTFSSKWHESLLAHYVYCP